jgi:hypothetical protein
MSVLGGFAAVAYVPQQCIEDAIDELWAVLWRQAIQSASVAIPSQVGVLNLNGGLRIDKPSISLRASTPSAVSARVSGRGHFVASMHGSSADVLIHFDATALVPLNISQTGKYFPVVIDFRSFEIASTEIEIEWSQPALLPTDKRTAILGDATRSWLAEQVRALLGEQLLVSIPFDDIDS